MSGFVALYERGGRPARPELVADMTGTLARRGPDTEGTWVKGGVGMGHRMLYTTPESLTEQLPLVANGGAFVLTSDARLDNRSELAASLGIVAEGLPDSALLLAAYRTWGTGCTDRLVGDYAFALWDAEERRLFCARDPFGVRPLYYVEGGRLFACATEIKALLRHPDVPIRLNELKVADYLAGLRDDIEETIYDGILRLLPGHRLVVTDGDVRAEKYFELEPDQVPPQTDEEYADQFRRLFTDAVASRARSAFPVASHLSGGLDSSSVTAVARDVLLGEGRGPLHTYSLVFDDVAACDERPYIDAVTRQGGTAPHYIRGDRLGPLENVGDVYRYMDEGLAAGNQHLVWALFKATYDDELGIRVVLDGLDGDNVVGHGHGRFAELARAGDWGSFAREGRAAVDRFREASHRHDFEEGMTSMDVIFRSFGRPVLDDLASEGPVWEFFRGAWGAHRHVGVRREYLLRRYAKRALLPAPLLRRRRLPPPEPVAPLVNAGLASRIDFQDRLRRLRAESLENRVRAAPSVREAQRVILASQRISYTLEGTSHFAGAFGLESAHPFFDVRLVRFCLGLPSDQSFAEGWTRLILRRALQGSLPDSVQWRVGKAWMGDNYARGLFEQDADLLRENIEDLGPLEPYVNVEEVRRLREGAETARNEDQALLGKVATLSMWLKEKF